MNVREQIKRQSTINNYSTLAWVLIFSLAVVILSIADALAWAWLPAVICISAWLVLHKMLHPKCPFCDYVSVSMVEHGIVGNFCENCGESFNRELVEK